MHSVYGLTDLGVQSHGPGGGFHTFPKSATSFGLCDAVPMRLIVFEPRQHELLKSLLQRQVESPTAFAWLLWKETDMKRPREDGFGLVACLITDANLPDRALRPCSIAQSLDHDWFRNPSCQLSWADCQFALLAHGLFSVGARN